MFLVATHRGSHLKLYMLWRHECTECETAVARLGHYECTERDCARLKCTYLTSRVYVRLQCTSLTSPVYVALQLNIFSFYLCKKTSCFVRLTTPYIKQQQYFQHPTSRGHIVLLLILLKHIQKHMAYAASYNNVRPTLKAFFVRTTKH